LSHDGPILQVLFHFFLRSPVQAGQLPLAKGRAFRILEVGLPNPARSIGPY
jgi:hypothetical protein